MAAGDFSFSNSLVFMSIHSARMINRDVIAAVNEFLADFPLMMVIIYGDIEADNVEDDIEFTVVVNIGKIFAAGSPEDFARSFGFVE